MKKILSVIILFSSILINAQPGPITPLNNWQWGGNTINTATQSVIGTRNNQSISVITNSVNRVTFNADGTVRNHTTSATSTVNGTQWYSPTTGFTYYQKDNGIPFASWTNGTVTMAPFLDNPSASVPGGFGTVSNHDWGIFTNFGANMITFCTTGSISIGKTGFGSFARPKSLLEIRSQSTGTGVAFAVRNSVDTRDNFYVQDNGNAVFAAGTATSVMGTLGSGYASLHLGIAPSATTGNNYFIASNGTNDCYLNAPTDSADLSITLGNGSFAGQFHGKRSNSSLTSWEFRNATRPTITAGQPCANYYFSPNRTKNWKTGAISLDYNMYVESDISTANAASTMTDKYNIWSAIPVAGSNMTITRKWGFATNGMGLFTQSVVVGTAAKTPAANTILDVTGGILGSTSILTTGQTQGIGYATGSGSTVTQGTNRTTGVTINAINGAITLVSSAGLATYQTFQVTNSSVAATDVIIINQKSGTDLYITQITNVAAGSFKISYATTGGVTVEQPVFSFAVIKAVSN